MNFGGWDEFTVDNGQFRFPHGMLSSTIASLIVQAIGPLLTFLVLRGAPNM